MSSASIAECGPCASRNGDDAQSQIAAGADMASDVHVDIRPVAPRAEGSEGVCVDRVIALWRAAELALSPIVGRRGTLAMLLRTLALNRTGFDWLDIREDIDDLEGAIASLRRAFSVRRPQEGDAAAQALSMSFAELLPSLVGPDLARQLCASPALAGALPLPAGDDEREPFTGPGTLRGAQQVRRR